ncbi:MAG TPA: alpha/beta hydrolase [Gaiellaceae bacterium]|nr:alpha/beta hydrolase [Gaiellaceae bacterium]
MTPPVHDFGGTGPDLLLLHGGGDNLETWRGVAPLLDGFSVVAYDARGHGQSPTPDRASVEDMVAEVIEMAGPLERPFLVGHSMGGVNALLAAGQMDTLGGVVALDAVPRWWTRPNLTRDELVEFGRSRGFGWSGTDEELERQVSSLGEGSRHAELMRAVFRRNHERNDGGMLRRKPDPEYALPLAQIYMGPQSGLTAERIRAVRCPVLLLCSQEWVGEDARRTLAEIDVPIEWFDTGHYLHWDAPDAVARRIREFACAS